MRSTWFTRASAAVVMTGALTASGCGEFVRQSRSPSQLILVNILTAAGSGSVPTTFVNGPLLSDVRDDTGTIFDDFGQANFRVILRDLGAPGLTATATALNDVTITRYRVVYKRSDGRNKHVCMVPKPQPEEIAVPCPFDGAVTVTIAAGGTGLTVFELVRHVAKLEPPLGVLATNPIVLTAIADVTFFGRDQAGNEVSATGSVQVNFANFGG